MVGWFDYVRFTAPAHSDAEAGKGRVPDDLESFFRVKFEVAYRQLIQLHFLHILYTYNSRFGRFPHVRLS